jgi:hypothetical protein
VEVAQLDPARVPGTASFLGQPGEHDALGAEPALDVAEQRDATATCRYARLGPLASPHSANSSRRSGYVAASQQRGSRFALGLPERLDPYLTPGHCAH